MYLNIQCMASKEAVSTLSLRVSHTDSEVASEDVKVLLACQQRHSTLPHLQNSELSAVWGLSSTSNG